MTQPFVRAAVMPQIPDTTGIQDLQVKRVLDAVVETMQVREGLRGNKIDQGVTWRDLQAQGIAVDGVLGLKLDFSGIDLSNNPGVKPPALPPIYSQEIPGAPTGLTASGAMLSVTLAWTDPGDPNIAWTEIWRSVDNNIGNAVLQGTSSAYTWTDQSVTHGSTYYYWVRFVTYYGNKSSFNATAGTPGSTAPDAAYLLQQLTNQISRTQLAASLDNRINSTFRQGTAPTANVVGDVWYDTGHGNHAYWWNGSAWTDSQDQQIVTNTSTIGTHGSSIQTEQQVRYVAIAPDYDSSKTYPVNSVAQYNNSLWSCTTAISTPEAWNAAHWAQITSSMYAQYTVKLDVNGYVSGFGLMNTGTTSSFIVKTDTFAIVPAGSAAGTAGTYPFIVSGGSVYIDTAVIKDASITSAKIGSLAADKITAGTITAGVAMNALTFNGGSININNHCQVDASGNMTLTGPSSLISITDPNAIERVRLGFLGGTDYGLVLKDAAGNVFLDSGGVQSIDHSKVAGLGIFATAGQLTSSNISTYIAGAAIGNAQIGNAAVNTLQLAGQAVIIPVSAYSTTAPSLGASFANMLSATINSTGAPIAVTMTAAVGAGGGSMGQSAVHVRIVRDSTVIYGPVTAVAGTSAGGADAQFAACVSDTPGAGNHTYYLQAYVDNGNVGGGLSYPAIVLMETKR